MPKPPSKEETQAAACRKLLEALAASEGVGVRHCLTEPIHGLVSGTWVFGRLRVVGGKPVVSYEGNSTPPKR